MLNKLLNYIFPYKCFSCSDLVNQQGLCSSCWIALNFVNRPFCIRCGRQLEIDLLYQTSCLKCICQEPFYDYARTLFKFDNNIKKLIHTFKYYDKTVLASFFAKTLYTKYKDLINDFDIVIPVPMHRLKRLFRMYNQAQLLAKELCKISAKPIINDALLKIKMTKSQAMLTKKQRVKNIEGSIKFNKSVSLSGKNVILVDDVMTTGTTINTCSKILKKNGADKILVLCISST